MNITYTPDGNGGFIATSTTASAFDPNAAAAQITELIAQKQAAIALATTNAQNEFDPQIAALIAQLTAFNSQLPSNAVAIPATE